MPYPYTYFNPNKKEQAAIAIGSLLAGGLGATLGESPGDAIAKGIAGAAGGYGTGYDYYQKLMNDAFSRDLQNKRYDQYLKEYEEIDKPYKQGILASMSQRMSPEEMQYETEKRQLDIKSKRLDIRNKSKEFRSDKIPNSAQEYEYSKRLPLREKEAFEKFAVTGRAGDVLGKNQIAQIGHNLRQEIRQNPYIKDFQDVDQKYGVMLKALDESKTTNNLIAVDQALITLFNKMTDPASVVRESEYARTPSDQSMLNRIRGKAGKVLTGGAGLMPDERQALVSMANQFHNVYKINYDHTITDYMDLAKQTGIDPAFVGIPFKRKQQETFSAGTHAMPDGSTMKNSEMQQTLPIQQEQIKIESTKILNGKTYIKVNGQWFEQ